MPARLDARDATRLDLTVERPVVGGAMLARHHGRVVLIAGAIPGERVRVRVDRERRDVVHATTEVVLEPHPARRSVEGDPACGGQVYRHVEYPHQLTLKAAVARDALTRIARLPSPAPVTVASSPEHGYRMRARLRVGPGGPGFLREGSHTVCGVAQTGQLLEETVGVIADLGKRLGTEGRRSLAHIDLAENMAGDQRVLHFCLRRAVPKATLVEWTSGLAVTGATVSHAGRHDVDTVTGSPTVADPLASLLADAVVLGSVTRHAPSFYQSNRYLLPALVASVHRRVRGAVLDLYAGVGVFAVTLASRGTEHVSAVERDPGAVADLRLNADPASGRPGLAIRAMTVEDDLAQRAAPVEGTVIVDPPRVGLRPEVIDRVSALAVSRVVYVSCDVATFARDLRRFIDRGYAVDDVEAFDMFPNTAHVEVMATLTR